MKLIHYLQRCNIYECLNFEMFIHVYENIRFETMINVIDNFEKIMKIIYLYTNIANVE